MVPCQFQIRQWNSLFKVRCTDLRDSVTMAYFSKAVANIDDCLELLETDKKELKHEIQSLKEELESVGECKNKYIKDSIDLPQQEVNEREIELDSLKQDFTEIDCWSKNFNQSNIPVAVSQFLKHFCTKNLNRQDTLNSQIRHLNCEIKHKSLLLSKRYKN